MNMKRNHSGTHAMVVIRTLLALVLLTASAAGRAESFSELELSPQDALQLSLQETDEALRAESGAPDYTQIALYNEAWDATDSPTAAYVRPERKSWSICRGCEVHLGVGGTYHSFDATGGMVIPMTVSWDRGRWEFGVFHFGEQTSDDNAENVERLVARPYWGASLSRRFQFFERGPLRAIFGFGVSYRTEQDVLSATHWNFSSQLGLRFQSPNFPAIFELSARHWSNGGVRTPNRGQDFTILTVRFDH
jgi:hypothetical protein